MAATVLRVGQVGVGRLGLALSGGAVWGAAHIGVLRALDELGIRPDLVTGTSVGAVVGAAAAAGRSWRELDAFARTLKLSDFARLSLKPRLGVMDTGRMRRTLRRLGLDCDFDELPLPFAAVATDVLARRPATLRTGSVVSALRASAAVPLAFEARLRRGRLYVDGGVSANLPLAAAFELGADRVLGIRVLDEWVGPPIVHPIAQHRVRAMERRQSVLMVEPNLNRWSCWDMKAVPALIDAGYEAAMRTLSSAEAQQWLAPPQPTAPAPLAPVLPLRMPLRHPEPELVLQSQVA